MDIKQLEVFVTVAKHKSFSKAARELFLTQPTVSSHIQNLENEMQSVLLNRNNKTITLTDSGKVLYNHAIIILNDCKKAIYDIKEYSGKIEGSLNIVCSSIPEAFILPNFLENFCEKYPNITLTIDHCDSNLVIPEILSERVTFGIVGSKTKHQHIKYNDFIKDELVLICPKSCSIENINGYISIHDLKNLTFIMRKEGSGTRNVIVKMLNSSPVPLSQLNIRANVESNCAIIEMVKKGLGCSFVSFISVADMIKRNEINAYRIKDYSFERNFYFIHSKKKIFTPTEKKFLEFFVDYYDIVDDEIKENEIIENNKSIKTKIK